MRNTTEILQLFKDDTQQSINKLVEKAYAVAISYLRLHYGKARKIIQREDLTLTELAIDAIAPLFIKDDECNELYIISSFKRWQPKISTEEESLFFLNTVVSKKVEQHLFMLYREADPFFSKILDSVNYLIKKNSYSKKSFLGTVCIVKNPDVEFRYGTISSDQFKLLPGKLFYAKSLMLENVFKHLKQNTVFTEAIPLNALVHRIKNLSLKTYFTEVENGFTEEKLDLDQLTTQALNFTFEKLTSSYTEKNKLNINETDIFKKALVDIVNDLKDGGINPGLYKYVQPHFPGLSEKEYNAKYHNIFEYLFKVLKKDLAERLKG